MDSLINYSSDYIHLISSYFSLTTLSTVGFGDLYPRTDYERLTGLIILFGGNICFAVVNGSLLDTVEVFTSLNKDFDESEELDKFLASLRYFNDDIPLNPTFEKTIHDFFEMKWMTDKQ